MTNENHRTVEAEKALVQSAYESLHIFMTTTTNVDKVMMSRFDDNAFEPHCDITALNDCIREAETKLRSAGFNEEEIINITISEMSKHFSIEQQALLANFNIELLNVAEGR